MKRLLLGVLVGGFLALVGVHNWHAHTDANAKSCGICVIGGQGVLHAPAAAPGLSVSVVASALADAPQGDVSAPLPVRAAARAPPFA